jgi:hypothetical protein
MCAALTSADRIGLANAWLLGGARCDQAVRGLSYSAPRAGNEEASACDAEIGTQQVDVAACRFGWTLEDRTA